MMNQLTSTALIAFTICAATHAIPDVQFHNVLTGSGAHSHAEAGGIQDSDPQESRGNNFCGDASGEKNIMSFRVQDFVQHGD